ncbi:DMT family transporter [Qipengyuania sp. 6D47A]|uniref:DMT family transporter n=2 Tax=Qipengyuania qiaonensis TaxID=2867240 RepID=A0ABS7JC78_9SPHN|nr:DMT family transporter [Qipengyuania qiaonensis]MBX7483931.1 DMT family transporter [Qipengyuania qiaonensis]
MPIFVTAFAVACLSLMDAFMKSAALAVGALTAAWLRSVIATGIALPLWLGRGGRWPRPDVLKIHLLRSAVATFMALSFFYSITKLPLAEAIAISFIAPLIALYLARVMLGETIRREAIFASILGFAGTLVIIGGRVGQADFDSDTALGLAAILASTLLYAYSFILIRRQSQVAGPTEIATFHSGVSVLILGLAIPFLFEMPGRETMIDLVASAVLTVAGAMAFAWAYARAEAQMLVPLEYSGFLWASLFGWLFFTEELTLPTVIGTAIIIASCWVATRKTRTATVPEAV